MTDNWVGIDYGSKLAGTTVICHKKKDTLCFMQSAKKQDADAFISTALTELKPKVVFLDAPLSLPSAYFGKGDNFFYRQCDVETRAMSPMFLGGLTARAMKLKQGNSGVDFKETYPAYFIKTILKLKEDYNKKQKYDDKILSKLNLDYSVSDIANWHQFDALCCWLTGERYVNERAVKIGNLEEGLIVV